MINHQGQYGGAIIITLYTFQESYEEAVKTLNKAKVYLEKTNKIKLLALPVPEDWHFVTTILYKIKELESKKTYYLLGKDKKNNASEDIDFKALKKFVNNKIGQNQKWTNKYIKLWELIKKYEKDPKDKEVLQKIIKQSDNLNIIIKK